MKQTTPLNIRVVANGYIISVNAKPVEAGFFINEEQRVFTDAESLAAFVAQFYAANHESPLKDLRAAIMAHEAGNGERVEVTAHASGGAFHQQAYRNLKNGDVIEDGDEYQCGGTWLPAADVGSYFKTAGDIVHLPHRRKISQLDAEGASK